MTVNATVHLCLQRCELVIKYFNANPGIIFELNSCWDIIGKSRVHAYVDCILLLFKIFTQMGLSVMMRVVAVMAPNLTMVTTMSMA